MPVRKRLGANVMNYEFVNILQRHLTFSKTKFLQHYISRMCLGFIICYRKNYYHCLKLLMFNINFYLRVNCYALMCTCVIFFMLLMFVFTCYCKDKHSLYFSLFLEFLILLIVFGFLPECFYGIVCYVELELLLL